MVLWCVVFFKLLTPLLDYYFEAINFVVVTARKLLGVPSLAAHLCASQVHGDRGSGEVSGRRGRGGATSVQVKQRNG